MKNFWTMRAETEPSPASADLLIYGVIGDAGENWGEVGAREFAHALASLPRSVRSLNIHINSPGGNVTTAQAMHSQLKDFEREKIIYIDGFAASAATLVAMAGSKVYARRNSTWMIHLPTGLVLGTADDMRSKANGLDTILEGMISVYEDKTGMERAKIRKLLEAETWLTAEQAVEYGFADEVRGKIEAVACLAPNSAPKLRVDDQYFDLAPFHYRNASEYFARNTQIPITKEELMPSKSQAQTQEPPQRVAPPKREEEHDDEPETKPKPQPQPKRADEPKPGEEPEESEEEVNEERLSAFMACRPRMAAAISRRAIASERQRLSELDELDCTATAALVAKARADGKSAQQIALECNKLMRQAYEGDRRKSDASILNSIRGGDAPRTPNDKVAAALEALREASTKPPKDSVRKNHAHERFN
jgi:ATP-dependent Clp protease, protease subunit